MRIPPFLSGFIAMLLLGTALTLPAAERSANPAERSANESQLRELREKITALQTAQQEKRKKESEVRSMLAEAEIRSAELTLSLQKIQQDTKAATARLGVLEGEKRSAERHRKASQTALAAQLRAAFTSGKQEYLKLLLNQQDPARLGRTLKFYDYLNRARTHELTRLAEALRTLLDIAEAAAAEISRLAQLDQAQREEKQQLAAAQAEKKRALKKLANEIAHQDKQLASLRTDEKELASLLDKIEVVSKRVPLPKTGSLARLRGQLSWPSSGPLLHRYGESRHDGKMRWNGVLISGREGAEVSAIYHGRIVFSDWLRGFGLMTIVDHGDGYMSLYGHNQSLLKNIGDWVEAGEPIATMGNSGGQAEVALYFEIRHQGRAVDPKAWCRKG